MEPSPPTGIFNGKVPVTKASLVQVSSLSSEEHSAYLREKVDFRDEPALPDTSKFSHISEKERQVNVPAMVPSSREISISENLLEGGE